MSEAEEAPSEPRADAAPPYSPGGRRIMATVANVLAPGSGQLILGRWRRALIFFGLILVGALALPYWPYAFYLWGGAWIASIVDAALTKPLRYPTTGRAVGIIVLTFFGHNLFRVTITRHYAAPIDVEDNSMAPTIRRGDELFARYGGETGVGHAVAYRDPCNKDKIRIGRVVAKAGDSVEIRCGVLYVNGNEVPRREASGDCAYFVAKNGTSEGRGWREQTCQRMTETIGGVTHALARLPDVAASAHDFPPLDPKAPAPACPKKSKDGSADQPPPPAPEPPPACRPTLNYKLLPGKVFVLGDNRDDSIDSRTFGAIPADSVLGEIRTIWWSTAPDRGAQWNRLSRVH